MLPALEFPGTLSIGCVLNLKTKDCPLKALVLPEVNKTLIPYDHAAKYLGVKKQEFLNIIVNWNEMQVKGKVIIQQDDLIPIEGYLSDSVPSGFDILLGSNTEDCRSLKVYLALNKEYKVPEYLYLAYLSEGRAWISKCTLWEENDNFKPFFEGSYEQQWINI